jgi:hypothetical protein
VRRLLPLLVPAMLAACQAAPPPRDVPFDNAAGLKVRIDAGVGDPVERLRARVADLAAVHGAVKSGGVPRLDPGTGATFVTTTARFGDDPRVVFLLLTTDRNVAVCTISGPEGPAAQAAIPAAMRLCATEIEKGVSAAGTASSGGGGGAPAGGGTGGGTGSGGTGGGGLLGVLGGGGSGGSGGGAGVTGRNWDRVAGVYFRSTTAIGVGGMPYPDYAPVVLFADGSFYEPDEAPIEDLDLAAERRQHPRRWGRWTQSGERYVLTDGEGRSDDYQLQGGNFFRAFPAPAGGTLAAAYKRVSGGGNSAVGGEVTIAIASTIAFAPDGRFADGTSVGALGSGDTSGVGTSAGSDRRGGGRYTLSGHTLVLTGADGQVRRRFFAFGSSGTPATIDRDMLFIGDSSYVKDD